MASTEVVDLLSTDDEATLQGPTASKPISFKNHSANPNMLLLADDFDSTIRFEAPLKRRRISPSLSGEDEMSTSPGMLKASKHRASPSYTSRRKASNSQDWASTDKSDLVIFPSSVDARPTVSHAKGKAVNITSFNSEDSDDDLPDDLLFGPLQTSKVASALSERTAAVLANLSQSSSRPKPSITRKRSDDKAISQSKSTAQGSIDRRGVAGAEDTRSREKRKLTKGKRAANADNDEDKVAAACEKESVKAANKAKKAKEKEEEQERKRIQKEEKAREKRIAADLAEVNKSKLDKKDSTPEMIVDLPASMDGQSVNLQIRELLKTLGVDATLYQSPIPNTIRWRRKLKARWIAGLDHWEPIEHMEIHDEKHAMCLLSAKDFAALVMATRNDEDVETHVAKLKSAYKECIPIYMIEGLHTMMRKSKTAENRAYQERVISHSQIDADQVPPAPQHTSRKKIQQPSEIIDEDMIEDALLRLQVLNGCLVHHTNTSAETAHWVAHFTQHISTIPYRIQRMNLDTTFCMESGQVRTGEHKDDTFVKMLEEIHLVTPPIAHGIASEYPNIIELIKAFRKHGPLVLKDLQKSANRNGALTDRKIGPAISRRLYKIFTELDPTSTDV